MSTTRDETARIARLKDLLDPVLVAARGVTVRVPAAALGASARDLLLLAELYRREGRSALLQAGHLVIAPPAPPPWWLGWAMVLRWIFVGRATLAAHLPPPRSPPRQTLRSPADD
jgi:hypothetical protein